MFSCHANRALALRSALRVRFQQVIGRRPDIESSAQAGVELPQHRDDPLQLWNVLGIAPGYFCAFRSALRLCHNTEASHSIRTNRIAGGKTLADALCADFEPKTCHRGELG